MKLHPASAVAAFAVLLPAVALTRLETATGLALLAPLGALGFWFALVIAAGQGGPRTGFLARSAGAVVLGWILARPHLRSDPLIRGVSDDGLGRMLVGLGCTTAVLAVLALYQGHAHRLEPDERLPWLRRLVRAYALALGAGTAVVAAFHFARWNVLLPARDLFSWVAAVLLVEPLLAAVAGWFQPDPSARWPAPRWDSALLAAAEAGAAGLRPVRETLERQLGHRLSEMSLLRSLLGLLPAAAVAIAAGVLLSVSITLVPVGHQGVYTVLGVVRPDLRPPGLHVHVPWPLGRITAVNTTRIEDVALGHERDLAGPVLWTEVHFAGEQNLLLGDGDELVTMNVPIQFRVRDPIAFLQRTRDPAEALRALGERELFAVTAGRDGFTLMTTGREDVAARLRERLQRAVDQLGLGIELVFVGLKDVHPPVAVAPAFQEVVSAEEQRHARIDQARAYQVETASRARIDEARLRVQATTAARERLLRAQGEAARFTGPLDAFLLSPDTSRTRLRLEAIEEGLSRARRIQLVPTGSSRPSPLQLWLGSPSAPSQR